MFKLYILLKEHGYFTTDSDNRICTLLQNETTLCLVRVKCLDFS